MYKCGLVLEGGGSRGIYTAGVLDAFMENDIEFPYVIGVSMGSCCGASYLGKAIKRQHDVILFSAKDKRYMSFTNLRERGEYCNFDWTFGELSYDLFPLDQDEFEKSNAVYCVVATNAKTGKAEYFYPKSLRNECPEIRASCSMPGVTKGTEIGGELYFDGGLADSIPAKRALEDGCEKAVTILTQHKGYVKRVTNRNFKKPFANTYPLIGDAIINRSIIYNNQIEEIHKLEAEGKLLVIQPLTPLNCNALEKSPEKLEAIYQLGYTQGLKNIEKVRDFMK
ncbi:MAG: patatin family protein [Eubacterium sp.]|nr:patatin family protein [Eubacterium sp.]